MLYRRCPAGQFTALPLLETRGRQPFHFSKQEGDGYGEYVIGALLEDRAVVLVASRPFVEKQFSVVVVLEVVKYT